MAAGNHRARLIVALTGVLLTAVLCAACGHSGPPQSVAGPTTASRSAITTPSGPLRAPRTSVAQDSAYLDEVTVADPALTTYEQKLGNVALRALLTDGSAFCALLRRGGGIDAALVGEADGARGTETQTSLPLSITTFNTIEAVALLVLCPSEQALLPASDRSKIRRLGASLAQRPS